MGSFRNSYKTAIGVLQGQSGGAPGGKLGRNQNIGCTAVRGFAVMRGADPGISAGTKPQLRQLHGCRLCSAFWKNQPPREQRFRYSFFVACVSMTPLASATTPAQKW